MTLYFIKAILCALFFLFIYMILFEWEKMHRFKRHYLLCSLVLSFVIPLVVLDIMIPQLNEEINRLYTESKIPEQIAVLINGIYSAESDIPLPVTLLSETSVADNAYSVCFWDYTLIAKALYAVVSLALLLRLSRNLFRLLFNAKRGKRIIHNNKKIILIKENLVPFSFGTCIYINEDDYNNGLIAEDMIRHEQAHIEQRHSLDIIFIELLITVLWLNPALYIYRRKIKQNHEFMADEAVLKANNDVTRYQNILISIISKNGSKGLASSLNYSTIKKRFIMMKKETSQRKARYKKALLIPVMLLAICIFSTHTIANEPPAIITENADENKTQEDDFVVIGKGISDDLLIEYQSIVNKYIEKDSANEVTWIKTKLSREESDRLYILYMLMNQEQRKTQFIHFLGLLNTLEITSEKTWSVAKKSENLLLNGKKAAGSELNSYNHNDIFCYPMKTKEGSYIDSYWTRKGREDYIEQYKDKIPLSVLMEVKPSYASFVQKYDEDQNKFRVMTEIR